MPATVESVSVFLGLTPGRQQDLDALEDAVLAANEWVASVRPDITGDTWSPLADRAATQQAARFYGRRGSVQGVAAFQEAGVSLLPDIDPDVKVMLALGKYQPSVVA